MTLPMAVALFLLANLAVAMYATAGGGTAADRMLVALLFGSTGVGILALLAAAFDTTVLIDVALVLALLAAVTGIAFARRAWVAEHSDDR